MIYTAGYYGRDIEQFQATVERLDALVLDIRLVPWSRFFADWRRSNLESRFTERYIHVPEFGNLAYKEKRIEIKNFDFGLKVIERIKRNVIMLCACKSYENCHRRTVAELLREHGFEVEEIPYA